MAAAETKNGTPRPKKDIRRFDVFAEYSRLERQDKGYPKDESKGYGIWLAKVVASRKFASKSDSSKTSKANRSIEHAGSKDKFRSLGDELQTDQTFDHEVIERMGKTFYAKEFRPAMRKARKAGQAYAEIRDLIRKDWKAKKPGSSKKA
jgi:hypothetical protein